MHSNLFSTSALPTRQHLHPFPLTRPEIRIVESREKITAIDCLELQWWFAIPPLGDRTMSAFSEIDTLALSAINVLITVGPAMIEQVSCVEIQGKEHPYE